MLWKSLGHLMATVNLLCTPESTRTVLHLMPQYRQAPCTRYGSCEVAVTPIPHGAQSRTSAHLAEPHRCEETGTLLWMLSSQYHTHSEFMCPPLLYRAQICTVPRHAPYPDGIVHTHVQSRSTTHTAYSTVRSFSAVPSVFTPLYQTTSMARRVP